MRTVVLSDGRELEINLYSVTLREWRSIFDPKQQQGDENEIVARLLGLTVDEMLDLPQSDWRKAMNAALAESANPEADKKN